MSRSRRIAATGALASLLVLAACQAGTSSSPSASSNPCCRATPRLPHPSPPGRNRAQRSTGFAGKLVICIDIPYPPQEFFDANQQPTGPTSRSARRSPSGLGSPRWSRTRLRHDHRGVNGRQVRHHRVCPEHQRRPAQAGRHDPVLQGRPVVRGRQGQPEGNQGADDLCGKQIGAESGTTEAFYVEGRPATQGGGLAKERRRQEPAVTDPNSTRRTATRFSRCSPAPSTRTSPTPRWRLTMRTRTPHNSNFRQRRAAWDQGGISVPKDKTGLSDAVVTGVQVDD